MKTGAKILCFTAGIGMFALAYAVLFAGPSYGVSFMSILFVVTGIFLLLLPKIIDVIGN